ncbi:hypothetical protein [Alkalilimnicola ehrlichii]|nr:hypothetical protein [Alkalilimnicola ehrlichii]
MLPLEDAYGHVYRAEALVREGPLHRDVTDFSKERIIQNFLYEYQRHIHWTL